VNIDCGGGIAITGSNAFLNPSNTIDAGNLTNTCLNLKFSGTNNYWCYIRQIGGDNAHKLAFDFHDDEADARFCIRKIRSTANPDIISEVFTVDDGNLTIAGDFSIDNGLVHLPKSGNSTGTLKLGLGGVTGADDTTDMTIELNGVSNGSGESGNIIMRTSSHIKCIHNIIQLHKYL